MHAEDAVCLLLDKELDLALGVQIRLGPRIGEEREPANFILHPILLQVLLGLTNPRHFRMRIYHARNRLIIHVAMSRAYIFSCRDAFLFRLVGEHRSERNITDAFNVRNAGVELVVDHDAPARIDFDADVFEVEALDIWPTADSNENNIGLELRDFRLRPRWQRHMRGLRTTHRLLFAVLRSLRRDGHLPINLLGGNDFCAQLKMEPLLR